MNVSCPSCQTVFRVDPEKIPAAGIKARCARCSASFRLDRSGATTASVAAAPPAAPTTPARAPSAPAPAPIAAAPPPPPPAPAPVVAPPVAAPAPIAATAPQAPAAATAPVKRRSFRDQTPESRAQRIARALVSDIVAYNKAKLKESRAAGTVRNEFREEIRKSWEEYVEQVGLDMAKSTSYFRDSLNDILAEGQKLF